MKKFQYALCALLLCFSLFCLTACKIERPKDVLIDAAEQSTSTATSTEASTNENASASSTNSSTSDKPSNTSSMGDMITLDDLDGADSEKDYSKYEDNTKQETTITTTETTPNTNWNHDDDNVNVQFEDDDNDGRDDNTGLDQYLTDPIPDGKPKPVEPEDTTIDKGKVQHCTLSIRMDTILDNVDDLDKELLYMLEMDGIKDGCIYATKQVSFYEGESVYDVLIRETKGNGIHMEASFTPMYNSAYVEGIHNFYEFSCGELSGWMYSVNDWYPNYGCSRYLLKEGDNIEWNYTCDLGRDLPGGEWLGGLS